MLRGCAEIEFTTEAQRAQRLFRLSFSVSSCTTSVGFCAAGEDFFDAVHAGGVLDGSRRWSAATPPDANRRSSCTPEECQKPPSHACACTPPGCTRIEGLHAGGRLAATAGYPLAPLRGANFFFASVRLRASEASQLCVSVVKNRLGVATLPISAQPLRMTGETVVRGPLLATRCL
jgi:hypothetical protein